MPNPDPSWDFLQPESKPRVLASLRGEFEAIWSLLIDPAHWSSPTACAGWDTRDMAGHLLDASVSYLAGFDAVRRGDTYEGLPAQSVAAAYDEAARAYRSVPREALLDELRAKTDQLLTSFDSLSAQEWTGLVIPDRYAGPLPATALATGLLAGYAVHRWDLHDGRGERHVIDADVADLLVPFVFALWAFTADTAGVTTPLSIGVRTTGRNGGAMRVEVTAGGVLCRREPLDGCAGVVDLDPSTLVLFAYGRVNAGTVDGERSSVDRFLSLIRGM